MPQLNMYLLFLIISCLIALSNCQADPSTTVTPVTTTAPSTTTLADTTTTALPSTTESPCGPPDRSLLHCNQYLECVFTMWFWDYKIMTCPAGENFDTETNACSADATCTSTTSLSSSTTPDLIAIDTTTAAAAETSVTPINPITTTVAPVTTTIAPLTTTTSAPTTQSPCGPADRTGLSCNQYLVCVQVMWFWDYKIMTCPTGQGFDVTANVCSTSVAC